MIKLPLTFLFLLLISFSSCDPQEEVIIEEINIDVLPCTPETSDETLEIVTWNLERFPLTEETPEYIDDILDQLDADIIAVQEIVSPFALSSVIEKLEDWEGKLQSVGDLKLGFLYKPSVVSLTELEIFFDDDSYVFPRPMVSAVATLTNSQEEIHLFNIHLKCCGDSESRQRRSNAMSRMKSHLDGNNGLDNVVLLGDFNEAVEEENEDNIFNSFLNDTEQWLIADMDIAEGSEVFWSYPSFPSHIDHILISDELFDNLEDTETILLESCLPDYDLKVSDHRPVMSSFDFGN